MIKPQTPAGAQAFSQLSHEASPILQGFTIRYRVHAGKPGLREYALQLNCAGSSISNEGSPDVSTSQAAPLKLLMGGTSRLALAISTSLEMAAMSSPGPLLKSNRRSGRTYPSSSRRSCSP
mmetsp:Transcript_22569/g.68815  ORF Transcript_22569/g.68815 Transcript_22569/m.68815 type:complete len:121 (-) Transcript_22569:471-833(-)